MSFRSEIEENLPALLAFSSSLTRDGEAARDLVQETVVRALEGRRTFDGGNMRAWLFTIARNRFLNEVKRRKVGARAVELSAPSACGLWASQRPLAPDSGWSGRDVREAMASLTPEHRDVLQRLADGRTYEEIAGRRPIGTVMSRIHRARAKFAEAMP